jgi:hypothetical protein
MMRMIKSSRKALTILLAVGGGDEVGGGRVEGHKIFI